VCARGETVKGGRQKKEKFVTINEISRGRASSKKRTKKTQETDGKRNYLGPWESGREMRGGAQVGTNSVNVKEKQGISRKKNHRGGKGKSEVPERDEK